MIKVYLDSGSYQEPFATFETTQGYMACLESIELLAHRSGSTVVESEE